MNAPDTIARPTLNAVPILPSLDFSQTRDFYVGNLGFEEVAAACDDYLVVQRDGLELHFWLSDDPLQCESTSVFFRTGAPADFYRDLRERGIDAIMPQSDKEHPVRFHVRDPHGNLLMFADAVGISH
ncbi:glyoxalase [Rhizobium sp. G187]|uniref:glyoxalase n=1 Tax=Rhizobium sp. G187 TaxID=3451352 RepID=UPI003EE6B74F